MNVKVKLLDKNAKVPFKKYNSDLCYDVVATSEEEIAPNVWKYGIGLAFEIDRTRENLIGVTKPIGSKECYPTYILTDQNSQINLSVDFRPRSSVWKTGMVLSNCEGTIDEDYRGEVSAVFYHVMPSMPRYKVGDRIGQIKLGITLPMEFEVVESLKNTERGDGGFGSTGK